MSDFVGFNKIARFNREVIVTEKIDGTNGQIYIGDDGSFEVGSRNRWITPEADNCGFARWAYSNRDGLIAELGPGRHFGEWWGAGIQRRYELTEKRFSLFNVSRWADAPLKLCHVVPVLWTGLFEHLDIRAILADLRQSGSKAAPGFMNPEGIIIFHTAGKYLFKKTFDKDAEGKG